MQSDTLLGDTQTQRYEDRRRKARSQEERIKVGRTKRKRREIQIDRQTFQTFE